jgi:Tfp pilus assembly protein PilW
MLAMLVIMVIGLRVLIGLFSQFFTSTARNP